jgi:hypothetical protein
MGTSDKIDGQTLGFWANIYRQAAIYAPEHGVLVANLGEWAGFWAADRFIETLGVRKITEIPDSNRSQVNTLTEALYTRGMTRPTGDAELLALVDGIVESIFDGIEVEWSTLRKLMSVDSIVKREISNDNGFDVVEYAHNVLVALAEIRAEGRDYFGNQTNEMIGAIDHAGYGDDKKLGDLLSPKAADKADEYGDKEDRELDKVEADPDAGLHKALAMLNRALTGDRKVNRDAYFRQELAKFVANANTFLLSEEVTESVDTTV